MTGGPGKPARKWHDAHRPWDCQKFCVRDFCAGEFRFVVSIENEASEAWSASLLGCSERSSPKAAWRRAEGAGLDGEAAGQAMIGLAMMPVAMIIALFLENAHRTGWQTGP